MALVFFEIAMILCQRQQAASIIRAALAAIACGDFPVPGSSIVVKLRNNKMELVGDWGIGLLKYVSVVLRTQVKKRESLFMVLLGWQRFLCNIATRPLISRWDLCHYKSRTLVVKEILPKYEGVSGNFHSILRGENYQSKHKGFVHAVYL